jgi:plasmid maintenance system antidote protein VapI
MGGLAGHMSHLYDNPELTFKEIADIFKEASAGSLIGTEKTDGQNIFLSYSVRDGKAKAARNIGNIKSGGMNAAELAQKFAGRGNLEKSFNDAFAAFEKAVELFDYEKQIDIFGPNANVWYNAEVQDPRTSNVINYDAKALTIHRVGHKEFDKQSGRPLNKDVSANAKELERALEEIKNLIDNEEYRVQMNAFRNLDALGDDKQLNVTLSRLYNLASSNEMKGNNTIGQFLVKRVKKVVDTALEGMSDEVKENVVRRILKVKGAKLNDIYKMIPSGPDYTEQRDKIRKVVRKEKQIVTAAIFPLEDIVHDFSVEMLRGLESAFVLDNAEEVSRLKGEVSKAINAIENSGSDKAMEILTKQLKKLKDVENVSTAAEGFVFDYDGISYKFTGNFAPVNQILGLFRYGRGDVPAMQLNEEPTDVEDRPSPMKGDVAFVPGSFKPPHRGHFELLKSYLKDANKVVVLISDPQKDTSIRFIDIPNQDNKIEVTPNAVKRIFDLYIDDANLKGKIEVWDIWNHGYNNPIQFIYDYMREIGEAGDKKKVVLGVSTKDAGDEKRFSQMKQEFSKYPNLEIDNAPREPLGAISATDFRNAITKAMVTGDIEELQQYIPQGVSPESILKVISEQPTWLVSEIKKLEEVSSMAGGNVEGPAGGTDDEETLIREEELEETNMISRKEFIEELNLREKIREAIAKVQMSGDIAEESVRRAIRGMIQEEVKDAPYASTGINELETLLKKIIPVIEPDYKSLTTAEEQRESFRSHILTAVQNSLSPAGGATTSQDGIDVLDAPDTGFEMEEDQTSEDIEISVAGSDKFIDIEDKPAPAEDEEKDSFSVDGEEETGRNFAAMTWERIETNIVDSFRKLSNVKDRDLFYDYLIANLKLYFDKFDDELAAALPEPQSDIYDQEVGGEESELGAAETGL